MSVSTRFRVLRWVAVLAVLAIVCTLFASTLAAAGQSQNAVKSYIVIMTGKPVIAYAGEAPGFAATRPDENERVQPESPQARSYRAHLQGRHNQALIGAGAAVSQKVNDYTVALNGFSALLTEQQVRAMRNQPGVLMVLEDQMRYPMTDSSPAFLGLTGPASAYQTGYKGQGVVVGIIDTGIWPEHPSFADDGSYPAPPTGPLPCEFGNTAHNPLDVAFTCNNKLIGARQMLATYRALIGATPDEYNSARDDNGHGTHTASTAAGNAGVAATVLGIPRGNISGIAPRAHVIAYKGLGNQGGFTSDLAAAIDQAVADGVDVINYSIGSATPSIAADEIAFLFAADAGVYVATSAGNSGPGASTIGAPAFAPWVTTVGASTQSRFFQGTITLGNGAQYTGASITGGVGPAPLIDAATAGGDLCIFGTLNPAAVSGKIVLCRRGTNARAEKSREVLRAGGVGMIMYENSNVGSLFSDTHWVPSVHVDNTPGLAIKAYIAANPGAATASITAQQIGTWPYAPSMTDFSSRGPNGFSLDLIKPDITAPGIQILAGGSPTPDPNTTPPGELFQAIAGTSMSSPHMAGLFALMKQANPDWSAAIAKSAFMTTAHQNVLNNDRVNPATPFDRGAGHVNPGKPNHKGSAFQPGLAYDAGLNEYFGFLCDAFPAIFVDPAGTCAALAAAGVPTRAVDLNLPSIGISRVAGTETVYRTVTSVAKESGWRTYKVSVQAPPGYSVSVSPSTITLKSGQSATYAVTVTNVSAPLGQFRFGSLTWKDKTSHYEVYSPIAVRGIAFSAPAEVTGSGVSGSTSFSVNFGYTGAYNATAHGLVPATVNADTVLQDPNQSFAPSDVGAGGADAYSIPVSGAAHLRVALPAAGAEPSSDLDLYLYNPGGALVASSTGGSGSDEEINVANPANGTWTVFVHGWLAPGGSSDYTLYHWVISATPGGNMTASGPPSATIGTVGTVNVSWTGATAGQWHLGAVTHNQGATVLGRTLVEVDNR